MSKRSVLLVVQILLLLAVSSALWACIPCTDPIPMPDFTPQVLTASEDCYTGGVIQFEIVGHPWNEWDCVNVDGQGTTQEQDGIYFTWNWGDGSSTDSGCWANHTYSSPGTYTVTVTASDNNVYGTENDTDIVKTLTVTVYAVMHVKGSTGSDSNSGYTWATAKQTVQAGIDAAYDLSSSIPNTHEVWVAQGTYSTVPQVIWMGYGHEVGTVYYLKDGIALYGGFYGTETTRSETRDRETILQPAIEPISGEHYGSTVVFIYGQDSTILDGFTIQNGSACNYTNYGVYMAYCGGGILSYGSATISHNIIQNNGSEDYICMGSGMCCMGGSPKVIGNTIKDNKYGDGIATCLLDEGTQILQNKIINNGDEEYPAAAIYWYWSAGDIVSNAITGNFGTGILIWEGSASILFNTITANHYGIFTGEQTGSYTIINSNIISANTEYGIDMGDGAPTADYNAVVGNATDYGGGLTRATHDLPADADINLAWDMIHIQGDSDCIGAGDPTARQGIDDGDVDIDNQDRVIGSGIDIGCDESAFYFGTTTHVDYYEIAVSKSPATCLAGETYTVTFHVSDPTNNNAPVSNFNFYLKDIIGSDSWNFINSGGYNYGSYGFCQTNSNGDLAFTVTRNTTGNVTLIGYIQSPILHELPVTLEYN